MNDQIEDIQYKSGWKPIIREGIKPAQSNKAVEKEKIPENIKSETAAPADEKTLRMLGELSAQIRELCGRIDEQSNNIKTMTELLSDIQKKKKKLF